MRLVDQVAIGRRGASPGVGDLLWRSSGLGLPPQYGRDHDVPYATATGGLFDGAGGAGRLVEASAEAASDRALPWSCSREPTVDNAACESRPRRPGRQCGLRAGDLADRRGNERNCGARSVPPRRPSDRARSYGPPKDARLNCFSGRPVSHDGAPTFLRIRRTTRAPTPTGRRPAWRFGLRLPLSRLGRDLERRHSLSVSR